jgi:hypothetical protein
MHRTGCIAVLIIRLGPVLMVRRHDTKLCIFILESIQCKLEIRGCNHAHQYCIPYNGQATVKFTGHKEIVQLSAQVFGTDKCGVADINGSVSSS